MIEFPVSGVETWWWLPALVAFVISSLTSLGGLSGAFLLLPFQISVLGYAGPGVSATNLLYNIISTPGGVAGYVREKRMVWVLAWVLIAGAVPGVFIGALVRIYLLPDPSVFKLFAALVLAYIAYRLLQSALKRDPAQKAERVQSFEVTNHEFSIRLVRFTFHGVHHEIKPVYLFILSFVVGIIGAAYGIGGGAIIAPFLVAVFGIPVYAIAGPALAMTFVTSVAGVLAYTFYDWIGLSKTIPLQPDWLLGLSFGIGGLLGIYLGSRLQKFVPARLIKLILVIAIGFVVVKYLIESAGVLL